MFPYFVMAALAAPAGNEDVAKHSTLPGACDAFAKALVATLGDDASVTVGRISTAPALGLATGAGVELELTAALERARPGVVAKEAKYEIRGDLAYRAVSGVTKPGQGDDGTQKVPVVSLRVINMRTNREVAGAGKTFAVVVSTELVRLLGITGRLLPEKMAAEEYQQIAKSVDTPAAFVDKSRVRAAADSPHWMEVAVKKDGKFVSQPVALDNGLAVVKLSKGDEFVVVLSNPTDGDIGAKLYYDGMDSYHFAELNAAGRRFAEIYRVPPKKTATTMCWVLKRFSWEPFRIGEPESVALPPARDSKWGSLSVAIIPMRPDPKQPGRLLTELPKECITIRIDR